MTTSTRLSTHQYHDIGRGHCGLCGRRPAAHQISGTAPNEATSAGGENVPENQAGTNGKGKRTRTRTAAA